MIQRSAINGVKCLFKVKTIAICKSLLCAACHLPTHLSPTLNKDLHMYLCTKFENSSFVDDEKSLTYFLEKL